MLTLPVEQVRAGMVLAADVHVAGRTLLRAGTALSGHHLRRLNELGVRTLVVQPSGEAAPGGDPELLSRETRRVAYRVVRQQLNRIGRGFTIDSRPVLLVAQAILDEVLDQQQTVVQLSEVRAMHDYLFGHSVGVTAMAVLLGVHSGLDRPELKVLAAGSLLHDVGKVRLPERVWQKPGKLTEDERRLMEQHTVMGYELLRVQPGLDARSAHIAYQHHERWDGTGYPRGLRGEQIHSFSRIMAVADVFDALTTDRPYRPAWPRHEAIAHRRPRGGTAQGAAVARLSPDPVRRWKRSTSAAGAGFRRSSGCPSRWRCTMPAGVSGYARMAAMARWYSFGSTSSPQSNSVPDQPEFQMKNGRQSAPLLALPGQPHHFTYGRMSPDSGLGERLDDRHELALHVRPDL